MCLVGDDGGEEELWHVCSGVRSLTHVPGGGWARRGGSLPCTQWGMLSDTSPVGNVGGEEYLSQVGSEGCSVGHI